MLSGGVRCFEGCILDWAVFGCGWGRDPEVPFCCAREFASCASVFGWAEALLFGVCLTTTLFIAVLWRTWCGSTGLKL